MRAISDRKLREPYRSWIDRREPLPAEVRLLPRSIHVGSDWLSLLNACITFGAMGGILLSLAQPWRWNPATGDMPPHLALGIIGLLLWLVPLVVVRRLLFTIGARRDRQRGTLRQGLFLGPEGILVRLRPNRCHPIDADRFVVAKLFPPASADDQTLIIETLDGEVRVDADDLTAGPDEINAAARELWPSWSQPKALVPGNSAKRKDLRSPKKMVRAAFFFGGSMLTVFASLGAIIVFRDKAWAAPEIMLLFGLIGVAVSSVYLIYWFLSFRLSYRCPECRGKCRRVDDALPDIHYYCAACSIEWDTGLKEGSAVSEA